MRRDTPSKQKENEKKKNVRGIGGNIVKKGPYTLLSFKFEIEGET